VFSFLNKMEAFEQENIFSVLAELCYVCDSLPKGDLKTCAGCEQVYCSTCAQTHISAKKPLCTRCDQETQKATVARVLGKKLTEL